MIRVLRTGAADAFTNMAMDEALLLTAQNSRKWMPALRLYSWSPPAVSIGYFQSLEEEVDVAECKRRGVDIVRRTTGGGAVFHHTELTYSFITREYPPSLLESYRLICGAILEGLKGIGVEGEFSPLNDLTLNGKKFSGNAQTRKKGVLLQHGTILLDVDADLMFSLLKVPDEKMKDKLVKNVKERVTALKFGEDAVMEAVERGFSEAFGGGVGGEFTNAERSLANQLIEKYKNGEWLRRL